MLKVIFEGRQVEFVCPAQMKAMCKGEPRVRDALELIRLNIETQGKFGSKRAFDRAWTKVDRHMHRLRL